MSELFHQLRANFTHLAPILLVGFVVAAIVIERVVTLFFRYAVDSVAFMQSIQKHLINNDIDGALKTCESNKNCLLSGIVKAGLMRSATDPEHIRDAVEIAALDVSPKVQKRIGYLPMLSNVATLLGLLGTIGGLIQSFKAIATADAATRQSLLAEGISVAMNATALGLAVAIPAMVFYSILSGKSNKYLDDIEKTSSKIADLLNARLYKDIEEVDSLGKGNVLPMPSPKAKKGEEVEAEEDDGNLRGAA